MAERSRGQRAGRLRTAIATRARGSLPLGVAFWDEMLIAGTGLNLAASLSALALAAMGAPGPLALVVFFAPLPVNLLLVTSVWRSARRARPLLAVAARGLAVLWLAAVTTI